MAMEILFIEFHDFWLLLDRVVATNGIKASNPPLTTAIFAYVAQIGKCYKYRLSLSWHKPNIGQGWGFRLCKVMQKADPNS